MAKLLIKVFPLKLLKILIFIFYLYYSLLKHLNS